MIYASPALTPALSPRASHFPVPLSGLRITLVLFFPNTLHMLTVGT